MRTVSLLLPMLLILLLVSCTEPEPEAAPTEVSPVAVPVVPTAVLPTPTPPTQATMLPTATPGPVQPAEPPGLVNATSRGIEPSEPAVLAIPSATAAPTPTLTPVPAPTSTSTPEPTPTPTPTATPIPTPTAIPTPLPPPTADTLPWVVDGIDGILEQRTLDYLRDLETRAPAVFLSLATAEHQLLPPESDRAFRALELLESLALVNEPATARLAVMPFLFEVEYIDLEALGYLQKAADIHPAYFNNLVPYEGQGTPITDELAGEMPISYLELFRADAGARIRALPWVNDGITYVPESEQSTDAGRTLTTERQKALILVDTAQTMPEVFNGLVGKQWMQRHHNGYELGPMEAIIELAQLDRALALKILAMPFMDTYQTPDNTALRFILELRSTEPLKLERLLSAPELAGGITDASRDRLTLIYKERYLESPTEIMVRRVTGSEPDTFPLWLSKPMNQHEEIAGVQFLEIWHRHTALAKPLVDRPWAAPELTQDGRRQIERVFEILVSSDQVAGRLAVLWEKNGYSEPLSEFLHRVVVKNPQAALLFLDLDWVGGEVPIRIPQGLWAVVNKDKEGTELLERVLGMNWVADGLNEEENEAVELLASIWGWDVVFALIVLELDWVNDGTSVENNAALLAISTIIYSDPSLTGPYQYKLYEVLELGGRMGLEELREMIHAAESYQG
ncbi:MAG: hypothetical protein OXE17_07910 [Chloroflexi bacterium]|nr:hypothetical protein [Chloroflexota bacterium]